jgi:predicted nucleic acid-binding protein
MLRTKELMIKDLLSINDATHLAVCENYNVKYLLTLDGDFIYAENSKVNVLKI